MKRISQAEITKNASKQLQNHIKMPEWAAFVKTGVHKERTPTQDDWWYIRAGSILNRINSKGPVGVNKLRNHYGGKKNRGVKPEHHMKGSGKIIRTMLQQLEKAELIKQDQKGKHKGRVITKKGIQVLFGE